MSGKLSVLTERSEENLTEYQRTIQSVKAQHELIRELDRVRQGAAQAEQQAEQHDLTPS